MAAHTHSNVAENIHHLIQSINKKSAEVDAWVSASHTTAQEKSAAELQRIFDAFDHVDKHKYAHTLGEWMKVLAAECNAAAAAASEDPHVDKDAAKYEFGTTQVEYYDAFPDPAHKNSFPVAQADLEEA
jgi:hypothetical protein